RKSSQESDSESARETSSDSSSGYCHERGQKSNHGSRNHLNALDACNHALERVSLSKPFTGSPSEETESCNPPGQLIFQYFEHETPYNQLKTYWSCDLSPASWVSLAWYPIYRIPTGPTLQSLSACFLTFHSLSTALQSSNTEPLNIHYSRGRDISSKLSLPIFGLAHHKFKISIWDPDGVSESQKANSLARAAENWLRLLQNAKGLDQEFLLLICNLLEDDDDDENIQLIHISPVTSCLLKLINILLVRYNYPTGFYHPLAVSEILDIIIT
ncbi:hypothetical protein L195_g025723, partial [Trifolium pratense]